ncbi:antA/AntB antirepressor family protein [Wohlfahrtiimonas populi]|uniref:antA/AntB antirepressor family protein n=1 Tax=Wohlfahrtiimonas populi TaxID=1940240 RepID=UPI00098D6146|nr:antA/AntB antirepressor family protein [Wohlfahrtiimonas populi]
MELIKIELSNINNQDIKTVNARELHAFLESKQDYSTWIKSRIETYGFEESADFIRFHKKMEANNATVIEYHISVDMAKELSMVERNEKGKQARQYFIKCEEIAKSAVPQIPTNFADALQLAADQAKQLEQQAPKVNYFDKVVERENLLNATQVAQKLKMSAVKMNRYLDEMKVYNNTIKRGRAFQQWFVDKSYGVMRQTELGYAQPMFTLTGEAWIIECLTAEGVA